MDNFVVNGNNKIKMKWIIDNKPTNVVISYFMGPDYDIRSLLDALKVVNSNAKNTIMVENNPVFPDKDKFLQVLPVIMKPYSNPKSIQIQNMNF